ncbi:MAG: crossover junction endodeoxyribonuclease RuvC [Planctomycetota bacterium]|nr:MAG: crossover junction endodeoxyribonuclease RuvC [Planctomycetota bacterium]
MARVLGVDPGSAVTGYALVEVAAQDERPRLVEAGVVRLPRRAPLAQRLVELERDLTELIDRLEPEQVAVEAIFSHVKRPRSAIVMGHARGVMLLVAARAGKPLCECAPAAVKRSLTGNGQASKATVQRAAQAQLGLAAPPTPHDVADAIAVALTAVRRRGVDAQRRPPVQTPLPRLRR